MTDNQLTMIVTLAVLNFLATAAVALWAWRVAVAQQKDIKACWLRASDIEDDLNALEKQGKRSADTP